MKEVTFKAKTIQVEDKDNPGKMKNISVVYKSVEGKEFQAGTKATVTDKQAAWLDANGFIKPLEEEKEDKKASKRETK